MERLSRAPRGWSTCSGLAGRTLSTRLLLLPTDCDLAGYVGHRLPEPVYAAFAHAHVQARAGMRRRLLAELRLPRDLADLDSVAGLAFLFGDYAEGDHFGTRKECTTLVGQLGGVILEELIRWRVQVPLTESRSLCSARGVARECVLSFPVAGQRLHGRAGRAGCRSHPRVDSGCSCRSFPALPQRPRSLLDDQSGGTSALCASTET